MDGAQSRRTMPRPCRSLCPENGRIAFSNICAGKISRRHVPTQIKDRNKTKKKERGKESRIRKETTPQILPLPRMHSSRKVRMICKNTMRYAGIGSRKTPPDILKLMEEIAWRLRDLGWTLQTGACAGAD